MDDGIHPEIRPLVALGLAADWFKPQFRAGKRIPGSWMFGPIRIDIGMRDVTAHFMEGSEAVSWRDIQLAEFKAQRWAKSIAREAEGRLADG